MKTVERHDSAWGLPRIALIAAALVALIAVGIALWRQRAPDPATTAGGPADPTPQADVATMIAQLEAKMKENPNDAAGWRMLGWSYYRTERFADAASAYRRATRADPENAEGWSALGEAISLEGKGDVPAEAEAAFRRAVAIDPADPRARYFLAVRQDLAGDHKGAIDGWLALLKDTPAGAPWEANVRETIRQVAAKHGIDIASRLPAPSAASPAGPSAATDAIPGPTREQMSAAAGIPPSQQDAMVQGMVESLAGKLKANPRDADGWLRLMRARMVLGDRAAAARAWREGAAAFADDKATQAKLTEGARALGVPGA